MSLYLCLFEDDREIAGVEVGGYDDFHALRAYIAAELEWGAPGSRFPVLMRHSDCDGEWPVEACRQLQEELAVIAAEMKEKPARPYPSAWQEKVAAESRLAPSNAWASFLDVDGDILLEKLSRLAQCAVASSQPILFQ